MRHANVSCCLPDGCTHSPGSRDAVFAIRFGVKRRPSIAMRMSMYNKYTIFVSMALELMAVFVMLTPVIET